MSLSRLLGFAASPLFLSVLCGESAPAQVLLRDLNTSPLTVGTQGSSPRLWTDATSATVFVADAGAATSGEKRLWRSDGTASGTQLVEPASLRWIWRSPVPLARLGNEVVYRANDPATGYELWITDGTPGDARSLGDLTPGPDSTEFGGAVVSGGRLWMTILRLGSGLGIVATDGTPAGIVIVPGAPTPVFGSLGAVAGGVLYSGRTAQGLEPVFTDGTAAGTRVLGDLEPGTGSSSPQAIGTVGGRAVFLARTTANGAEPWVTDGTPVGTRMLADLAPGAAHSTPSLVAGNDRVLWMHTRSGDLVTTDGTPAGTRVAHAGARPSAGAMIGDRLVYVRGVALGSYTLAIHDGRSRTDLGVFHLVLEVMAVPNGEVFFIVRDAASVHSIWATDGTVNGTRRVDNLPANAYPLRLGTAHRGKVFISARHPTLGVEPWVFSVTGTVERVGRGCPGGGRQPVLDGDPARIGGNLSLRVTGGAPSAFALAAFGPVPSRPVSIPGIGACTLLVNLRAADFLVGTTAASGAWTLPVLPIPAANVLIGLEVAVQAGFDAGGLIELSNALHMLVGR